MIFLLALAAALAPLNPLPIVTQWDLAQARDRWLLGVLALGTVWLAAHGDYWLALMALWHALVWSHEVSEEKKIILRSSLILWASIGVTWELLRSLSTQALDVFPWVWLAWGVIQSAVCVYTWLRLEWPTVNRPTLGKRTKGTYGSPVLTGIYLAMIAPFAPWWAWLLLAPGIWLTNSWTAAIGLALGGAWRYPGAAIPLGGGILIALLVLFASKYQEGPVVGKATWWNQRIFEGLPRGDSIDGWYGRWAADRLLLYYWWHSDHRWLGHGPGTVPKMLMRWNSRLRDRGLELPNGSAHCDVGELTYEHGLIGFFAAVAFAIPILANLRLGDPWSAVWIVTVVVSLGHWPMRHPALAILFLIVSARLAQ